MSEVPRIQDEHSIHAGSARLDDRTRVLKHGDLFAILDRAGNVEQIGSGEAGLYHGDTRHLSRWVLTIDGKSPALLSSSVREDNANVAVDLTNPDLPRRGGALPGGVLHLRRSSTVFDGEFHERIVVRNFDRSGVEIELAIGFAADFADIFEVRGTRRKARGRLGEPLVTAHGIEFRYEGRDARTRHTRLRFDPAPTALDAERARFVVRLAPGEERSLRIAIACVAGADRVATAERRGWYEDATRALADELARARASEPRIESGNEQFDRWLAQSLFDLHMMRTETEHGPYPYAGVPWFSTPFGRDGLITAWECLWFDPALARGVLSYLAATQARDEDPARDAEPGKILHEARAGEMAATGEVPFGRYYGTVDATPLFVALAGAYHERTGDHEFLAQLGDNVERALAWIERHGDRDGDGFVEYSRRSEHGLAHQGWKDSPDPVFHADGTLADAPIALCEVQGYTYAAWLAGARLARLSGDEDRAREHEERARALRRRFEEAFWCEDIGTYAIALDGDKRPCRVRSSNPGHCLFHGIVREDRAARLASTLLEPASFSGWGVRTIADGEARYNPMSYHNGSIWPHDNAIVAAGLARYGHKDEAARILTGLFEASLSFDLHRLPELFCGFPRRHGEDPTRYPVSCAPQAWASGAVLLALSACLGLDVRGGEDRIVFDRPVLPPFLPWLVIEGLRVGAGTVDLRLERHAEDVSVNVLRRTGRVLVEVRK